MCKAQLRINKHTAHSGVYLATLPAEPAGLPLRRQEAEEQLSRVLPARVRADSRSGWGLPRHAAHRLALLPPGPLHVGAERRHALPRLVLFIVLVQRSSAAPANT